MYIAGVDRTSGEDEWRPFVVSQGFGHLVTAGRGLDYPVVVPTQFVLEGDAVLLHLASPNPAIDAIRSNPRVLMSVAGDWAFVPSAWKAVAGEDPALGIPTTYYAAVQLMGRAEVIDDPGAVAEVLRRQLAVIQPDLAVADPEVAHPAKLRAIRAVKLHIEEVRGKFKYGGNVDDDHRRAVMVRLLDRDGPGDRAAAAHVARRLEADGSRS